MKNTTLKKVAVTASLLISVVYTSIASAHDQGGSLGAAAGATDMYQITCYDAQDGTGPSEHLRVSVIDAAPVAVPRVSAQVTKWGWALNTTDAVDGNTAYSPEIRFYGGDGSYLVAIDKSAAGSENYNITYHCQGKTGLHTGTYIYPLQNQ